MSSSVRPPDSYSADQAKSGLASRARPNLDADDGYCLPTGNLGGGDPGGEAQSASSSSATVSPDAGAPAGLAESRSIDKVK